MTYKEKLLDPRWQKKRLEIFQRDNFTCVSCGCNDKTLHVHHVLYRNNINPWDYENITLMTLCEECHLHETNCRQAAEEGLIEYFKLGHYTVDDLSYVQSIIHTIRENINYPLEVTESIIECIFKTHSDIAKEYFTSLENSNNGK